MEARTRRLRTYTRTISRIVKIRGRIRGGKRAFQASFVDTVSKGFEGLERAARVEGLR